uniref:Uncharacterized protein n=1 Tax=Romanomermis culicivorax TaxID=13658 RepID=A0A915I5G2_ROMCU
MGGGGCGTGGGCEGIGGGTFGAVSSFECIICVKTLTSRKPLGTVPKQKDRPWSDTVQIIHKKFIS